MNQLLPFGGYDYLILSLGQLPATSDDSENGFFVEVDLESRDNLNEEHVFFALCPHF